MLEIGNRRKKRHKSILVYIKSVWNQCSGPLSLIDHGFMMWRCVTILQTFPWYTGRFISAYIGSSKIPFEAESWLVKFEHILLPGEKICRQIDYYGYHFILYCFRYNVHRMCVYVVPLKLILIQRVLKASAGSKGKKLRIYYLCFYGLIYWENSHLNTDDYF